MEINEENCKSFGNGRKVMNNLLTLTAFMWGKELFNQKKMHKKMK